MRTTQLKTLLATSLIVPLATLAAAQDIEAEIIPIESFGYDELYADGLSIEELLGADVNGPTGDDIGDVENVLFSEDGRVLSVIAEIGGFLELGDTHVNIPWDMVSAADWDEGIEIPLTQETVEDYTLFTDEFVTVEDTSEVEEVAGDNAGVLATGPRVWRATDVIGDTARLRQEGEAYVNYGYVDDLIVRGDEIAAVVVGPGAGLGVTGYYAYPYRDVDPELGYYDLPYTEAEIGGIEPFDNERLVDLHEEWDADADGILNEEEFVAGFGEVGIYNEWDGDEDGLLSEDEFNAGVYDGYDVDDDGLIGEPEIGDLGDDLGEAGLFDL